MSERMIFGILVTFIGFVFSAFSFIYAVMHPWNYNGIDGLMGAFLGTHTLTSFILGTAGMIFGLILCFIQAFVINNNKNDESV